MRINIFFLLQTTKITSYLYEKQPDFFGSEQKFTQKQGLGDTSNVKTVNICQGSER